MVGEEVGQGAGHRLGTGNGFLYVQVFHVIGRLCDISFSGWTYICHPQDNSAS